MTVATVPAEAVLIADLPEWCVGARVFMDDGWDTRHRAGLPRPVSSLLGRVSAAEWESDTEIDVAIKWGDPDAEWARWADEGIVALTLEVVVVARRVEVICIPAVPTEAARTVAALEQAAAELNARIATCFERVACPRCGAPAGEACRRMIGGVGHRGRHNKHPHAERIQADGIPLR